jgi:phosphopantothenoylcysteine decarboxylase/phosphopantothenate--cysteine ligase
MVMEKTTRARKVLLCASGGFQVYSLPAFVLSLIRHFADDVQVVLSRSAAKMTSKYAIEVASRHHVFVEMDEISEDVYVPHIELSRGADLILVYPATVNVLGKVAQGIADELIPAVIIAASVPVFFVPITNAAMWNHPAVQRSVKTLRDDGYVVLPPLPSVEVATREGLDQVPDVFPLPTLLAQMSAAVGGSSSAGSVRR